MGWNTAVIIVRRPAKDVLEALGGLYTLSDRQVGWDEASLRRLEPNVAVGELGEWTAVWNPSGDLAVDEESESWRRELSTGSALVAALWASVSDQIQLRYYVDGELERNVLYELGDIATEHGDPLGAEEDADEPGTESWLIEVVEGVIGASLESDVRYRVLEPD